MEGPEGNQKHVQNEAGQFGTKNSSICLFGDRVIICDRECNILIEVDLSNDNVKEFSGKGECKSADGCSSFCCFAQPFLVCCEEKSLFVIDRPTLTVRIITSLKPRYNFRIQGHTNTTSIQEVGCSSYTTGCAKYAQQPK